MFCHWFLTKMSWSWQESLVYIIEKLKIDTEAGSINNFLMVADRFAHLPCHHQRNKSLNVESRNWIWVSSCLAVLFTPLKPILIFVFVCMLFCMSVVNINDGWLSNMLFCVLVSDVNKTFFVKTKTFFSRPRLFGQKPMAKNCISTPRPKPRLFMQFRII
jgi:hypothetical protein